MSDSRFIKFQLRSYITLGLMPWIDDIDMHLRPEIRMDLYGADMLLYGTLNLSMQV
jgi:hypothetical protein